MFTEEMLLSDEDAERTKDSRRSRRLSSLLSMNEKPNKVVLIPLLLVLFVMIGYQYICPAGSQSCHFRSGAELRARHAFVSAPPHVQQELAEQEASKSSKFNFSKRDQVRQVNFDMKGEDVLVFLHIQKTGGTTFGRHLVRNMHLERPCDCLSGQKKCSCRRPGKDESWLFSRFSTGWSCGLHADWTELTSCVPAIMEKKRAPKRKK